VSWGPQAFGPVAGPFDRLVEGGGLAEWDTREQPNGPYTLRVMVFDRNGGAYEGRVNILIDNLAPAPTEAATPQPATDTPSLPPVTDTPTPEAPTGTPVLEPSPGTPEVDLPTATPIFEVPTSTLTPVTSPADTPTPGDVILPTPTITPAG
jgi:hypothetical protein